MNGSEFVQTYADNGLPSWEAAALALARDGGLTPWPWFDLQLSDPNTGDTATLKVQSDVLSIGPIGDHVRLPLTPGTAQSILNLFGALLPTPWLVYQIWRQSPVKLSPTPMVPVNAELRKFYQHSLEIDSQIAAAGSSPGAAPVAGIKKHVVTSNIAKPKRVLIYGWYKPAPDVYDDGKPWNDPSRQPIQVKSNLHGDSYVDYSHGIQAIGPMALVNGQPMPTIDLYQHPTLSKLVSNEGPVRTPRYPSSVKPRPVEIGDLGDLETQTRELPPTSLLTRLFGYVPDTPSLSNVGMALIASGL